MTNDTRWHRCCWCRLFTRGDEVQADAPEGYAPDFPPDTFCAGCVDEIDRSSLGEEVVIVISTDVAEELAPAIADLQEAYPAASIDVNPDAPTGIWRFYVEALGPYSAPCMASLERNATGRLAKSLNYYGVLPCPTK